MYNIYGYYIKDNDCLIEKFTSTPESEIDTTNNTNNSNLDEGSKLISKVTDLSNEIKYKAEMQILDIGKQSIIQPFDLSTLFTELIKSGIKVQLSLGDNNINII